MSSIDYKRDFGQTNTTSTQISFLHITFFYKNKTYKKAQNTEIGRHWVIMIDIPSKLTLLLKLLFETFWDCPFGARSC